MSKFVGASKGGSGRRSKGINRDLIDITLVSATSAEIHVRLDFGIVNPDRIKVDPSSGGSTLEESLTLNDLVSALLSERTHFPWPQLPVGKFDEDDVADLRNPFPPFSLLGTRQAVSSRSTRMYFRRKRSSFCHQLQCFAFLLVPTLGHLHVALHTGSRLSRSAAQILHCLHHHMAFACLIPTHLHSSFTKFHTRSLLKLLLVIS